jgi:hypothetical protein
MAKIIERPDLQTAFENMVRVWQKQNMRGETDINELIGRMRFLAESAEWKTVNRWIPCSERLPESFIYVLCAGRDGIGILRYIGSKWLDGEANAYTTNEITHWMPLPEPPEKEAENG